MTEVGLVILLIEDGEWDKNVFPALIRSQLGERLEELLVADTQDGAWKTFWPNRKRLSLIIIDNEVPERPGEVPTSTMSLAGRIHSFFEGRLIGMADDSDFLAGFKRVGCEMALLKNDMARDLAGLVLG